VFLLLSLTLMPRSRVLIFSATRLYRHESIPTAIKALMQRADEIDVQFDVTEDDAVFSDASLKQYDAVLFLSTSGNGRS
jgi:DNA-binding transcriptional LysR family regulator